MLTLTPAKPSYNDKQGSGKYTPMRRKRKKQSTETDTEEFSYLNSSVDLTMHFTCTKDPIYFVFEKLENRSVPDLMKEFVKDSFFEVTKFVSKVMK